MEINLEDLFLVIYQNENFVKGLYEIIRGGNIDEILSESEENRDLDLSTNGEGKFKVGGGKIPVINIQVPEIGTTLSGDAGVKRHSGNKVTQKTTYSNSYKLSKILEDIKGKNKFRRIDRKTDFEDINLGDFLEYTSYFAKNEIRELLEVLDDKLLKALLDLPVVKEKLVLSNQKNKVDYRNIVQQALESLKRDFNNEFSTEFYGQVLDKDGGRLDISNIIICDNQFFTNGDTDRALDGKFKVFGKVIDVQRARNGTNSSNLYENLSQLDRNKILKHISPEAMENFESWLNGFLSLMKMTSFDLIIKVNAIKVIPIAIYI